MVVILVPYNSNSVFPFMLTEFLNAFVQCRECATEIGRKNEAIEADSSVFRRRVECFVFVGMRFLAQWVIRHIPLMIFFYTT